MPPVESDGGDPSAARAAGAVRSSPVLRVVALDDPAQLQAHEAAWEDLCADALEPNVFYEPWALLPAVDSFASGTALQFLLVYGEAATPGGDPILCGLFPFERQSRYRGLPLHHVSLWTHPHCFLGTPLVRRGRARECLAAAVEWLARDSRGAAAVEWKRIAADGPFFQVLSDVLADSARATFLADRFTRALLLPRADAEEYLCETLPGKSRKEFRRLERRLSEAGPVEYADLGDAGEADAWIAQFLDLEASGWKGSNATALGSSAAGRRFFTRAAGEAARRGRLMMLGLRVAGQPVALKCNLLSGDGSFAFKIAFDEAWGRFSPGVLLELENIRRFHQRPELRWMDSCATPEHFMANRLWMDRRTLVTLLSATGRVAGDLLVSALPVLRWAYRALRGVRGEAAAKGEVS